MTYLRATLPLLLAALCAAGLSPLTGCSRRPSQAEAATKAALTVTLVSPIVSDWPERTTANGSVKAWQESIIGNEVSGLRLLELLVEVGDHVANGQVLARFNQDTVRTDLAQTEAAVAQAEAAHALAHSQAERTRQLAATGAVSTDQLQQSLTNERAAEGRLASAQAQLEAQRLRLRHTEVVAPDDGVISSRTATVGAVLASGSELFRLIRQSRLEWQATLPADRLACIAAGQAVTLHSGNQPMIAGRVRQISPVVDAGTLTGTIYVDLPVPSDLRAGMFASGEIEFGTAPALHVPESAIVYRDGYQYVMKVGSDRRVHQVKVVTGRRHKNYVELTAGTSEADRIVVAGGSFLNEGDTVMVAGEKTPAGSVTQGGGQ